MVGMIGKPWVNKKSISSMRGRKSVVNCAGDDDYRYSRFAFVESRVHDLLQYRRDRPVL